METASLGLDLLFQHREMVLNELNCSFFFFFWFLFCFLLVSFKGGCYDGLLLRFRVTYYYWHGVCKGIWLYHYL